MTQAGFGVLRGRSICVTSLVITAFADADTCQEHLHSFDSGVLAFIQNDKGKSFNVRPRI